MAKVLGPVIDPNNLKTVGFVTLTGKETNILSPMSVREVSSFGFVIDSAEELVGMEDILRVKQVLDLHFDILGKKVETRKRTRLGKVIGYTMTEDFAIAQLKVKRPVWKRAGVEELLIPRNEVVEVTDEKIIVKDEESTIRTNAEKEFTPNFVNPFRKDGVFAKETSEK